MSDTTTPPVEPSARPVEPVLLAQGIAGDDEFAVRWGSATHQGRRRTHNEDAILAAGPVFAVADGMGGHAQGSAASRAAVEAFGTVNAPRLTSEALLDAVAKAVTQIRRLGSKGASAPGTTLAGVGLGDQGGQPCWLVFNVGDSRTYRLAGGVLEQLSVDHSRVQELVDRGEVEAASARAMTGGHVITRALGGGLDRVPTVDQWLLFAATGDRILVCSDGLTDEVTDQLITATLLSEPDPGRAAHLLVEAALDSGGRDNVSVVVIDAVHVAASPGPDGEGTQTLPSGSAADPSQGGFDD